VILDRECTPGENGREIMNKLQRICNNIIDDLKEDLSDYNRTKKVCNEILQLWNDLDKIRYAQQLPFENQDNLRCTYIDF
jgi:hypothetical protein